MDLCSEICRAAPAGETPEHQSRIDDGLLSPPNRDHSELKKRGRVSTAEHFETKRMDRYHEQVDVRSAETRSLVQTTSSF